MVFILGFIIGVMMIIGSRAIVYVGGHYGLSDGGAEVLHILILGLLLITTLLLGYLWYDE